MKYHNCPYLENGLYCTHKGHGLRRLKKKKRYCGYYDPLDCKLIMKKSKKLLRATLIAIGKPFGLEVEETTMDKEKSLHEPLKRLKTLSGVNHDIL